MVKVVKAVDGRLQRKFGSERAGLNNPSVLTGKRISMMYPRADTIK